MIRYSAIPAYFAIRLGSAVILLKVSAQFLTVRGFADFTQFLAFASFLNVAVIGGAQNGIIRQAAAAGDDDLHSVHGAGLAILLIALPVLGAPVVLLSHHVSRILTGSPDQWRVVIGLTLLAFAAAPGQVCWSVLSGRRRIAQSLGAQALGIVAGTGGAVWFIVHGNIPASALAFAAGPLLATIVALPLTAQLKLRWRPTTQGLTYLLGYSAAIASTLGFSALVLFGLRWLYRDHFGSTDLGYWLAANRISDMSSQFLGLFMLQAMVPQITVKESGEERRGMIRRYGAAATLFTVASLLVFLAAGKPLVHLFMSDAYLPAIPSIRLYMLGDCARVWVSLTMFAAFAAGKPGRYAAIEMSTMALMAIVTVMLISAGEVLAPQIAYAAAFAMTALVIGGAKFLESQHPVQLRRRGERRTLPRDSVPRFH